MTSAALDLTVLDNAAWHALGGPHREFADLTGEVRRYHSDVSVFSAISDDDPASWAAMADAVGADDVVVLFRAIPLTPTDEWVLQFNGPGFQMVFSDDRFSVPALPSVDSATGASVLVRTLGDDDVRAMADLVALTQPGPFRPRTIDLGGYIGVFHDDQLVAMAGQRLRPPGFCEISAVCTHPDARRRGYASALTLRVAHGIVARGERPFLHLAASNTSAMAVYEQIGFEVRTPTNFGVYRLASSS